MILGIDEVGRGCWAGPLVVGAVVLGGAQIDGLTDSKKLSKKRRQTLSQEIFDKAQAVGLGWVSAAIIDEIGLSRALRLATKLAVKEIKSPFHEIILDGTVNFLTDTPLENHVALMPKADLLVPSVSAASIVAKVARDDYMTQQAAAYPGYGFDKHVGYGTAAHRQAIDRLGVCPEHRLSFSPLVKYRPVEIVGSPAVSNSDVKLPSTRLIGDTSEDLVASELISRGHRIVERNWKTKSCEIDIISIKDDRYYFTEVKHRKSDTAGDGLAAVTSKKLARMRYGVSVYAKSKRIIDKDLMLVAASTSGQPPQLVDLIEII